MRETRERERKKQRRREREKEMGRGSESEEEDEEEEGEKGREWERDTLKSQWKETYLELSIYMEISANISKK